jgi:hypothetical protein
MNATYKPRVGTIPHEIIEVLTALPNVTFEYITDNVTPRKKSASSWTTHAIWNAMSKLLDKQIVTRTKGINPSTQREVFLYKLA